MRIGSLAKLGQAMILFTVILVGVVTILVVREAQETDAEIHRRSRRAVENAAALERGLLGVLHPEAPDDGAAAKERLDELLDAVREQGGADVQARADELSVIIGASLEGDAAPALVLQALDRLHEARAAEAGAAAAAAGRRLQAGIAQVAVTCGLCVFLVFLVGGWITRNVTRPLRRLEESVDAMADGAAFRRAPEGPSAGAFVRVAEGVNRLVDRLHRKDDTPEADLLLLRAAVAEMLKERDLPAGVLDKRGRLIAGNERLRELMRGENGLTGPELLGREECARVIDKETHEVTDAGILRGYLLSRCDVTTAADDQ